MLFSHWSTKIFDHQALIEWPIFLDFFQIFRFNSIFVRIMLVLIEKSVSCYIGWGGRHCKCRHLSTIFKYLCQSDTWYNSNHRTHCVVPVCGIQIIIFIVRFKFWHLSCCIGIRRQWPTKMTIWIGMPFDIFHNSFFVSRFVIPVYEMERKKTFWTGLPQINIICY